MFPKLGRSRRILAMERWGSRTASSHALHMSLIGPSALRKPAWWRATTSATQKSSVRQSVKRAEGKAWGTPSLRSFRRYA